MDDRTRTVLVAGSSGYIGRHVVQALHEQGYRVRALVREPARLRRVRELCDEVFTGEATEPGTLDGCADGVHAVVSSIGLRTLRRRPTADEVDFRANLDVLRQARRSGVGRFVFVGVLNGVQLADRVPILRPRERFIRELERSDLAWTVLRPTGSFNDMAEIFRIARTGWRLLIGPGNHPINPIHPADIADVAVRAIDDASTVGRDIDIGGPDTFTQGTAYDLAADVLGKRLRTVRVPIGLIDGIARVLALVNPNAAGFARFFGASLSRDMVATPSGERHLESFYRELARTGH